MKNLLLLSGTICTFIALTACSSAEFKDKSKNTGTAYCEQQCVSNTLTASAQADCKQRCRQNP